MPITGGERYHNGLVVPPVTDATMEQIKALQEAGVGRPGPMSERAIRAVMALQSSTQTGGQRYKQAMQRYNAAIKSNNPYVKAEWEQANRDYLATTQKASPSVSSVHTDTALANLSTQYANDEYIGEQLMPPVQVSNRTDVYATYGQRDRLASPSNDVIADDGEAVDVVETRSTGSYTCIDRGNKRGVAANAIANQDAPLDELADLTLSLFDHRALRRELRIATVLNTTGNFGANTITLTGADQWNASGGGDPIGAMQTGDAALWRGLAPAVTRAFCSLDIYNVLSRHEDFLGLFQYSGTSVGLATPQMIAGFLGWDNLLVGRARYDSTPLAATATYTRIWGDFFGILRVAERQTLRSATFGMTMRWTMAGVEGANAGILTQQWFDPTKGLGGTHFAKVGESEAHEIQSATSGYLIADTLA